MFELVYYRSYLKSVLMFYCSADDRSSLFFPLVPGKFARLNEDMEKRERERERERYYKTNERTKMKIGLHPEQMVVNV